MLPYLLRTRGIQPRPSHAYQTSRKERRPRPLLPLCSVIAVYSSPRRGEVTTKSFRCHPQRATDALCDFQYNPSGGLGRNWGETDMAAWRRDAAWLVYRVRCRLPPCPNDAAHSSPHPGVLDLSWARIGALSLARKACCRMVILIRGSDELSIIMVIRTSLSFVRYLCVLYLSRVCTNVVLPQIVIV
jgi:hypothetical protein